MEKLLVIGGSGKVGSLVLPYLAERYQVRVFDRNPPADSTLDVDYVEGDIRDPMAVDAAMQGMELLLYMAMGSVGQDRDDPETRGQMQAANFDINVKGVYFALSSAHRAGINHAVYTSSLSVYQAMSWSRGEKRYYSDEDMPPDAQPLYGFTKRLGEEVCRNAWREWNMSVNALRLCFPTDNEKWLKETRLGTPTIATTAQDTANALIAALTFRGAGFQAFFISGDYEQKMMRLAKAKHMLGWEPLARPILPAEEKPEPA